MLTRGAVARSPRHQWAEHRHQSAFGLPSFGWYIIIAPNFRSDRYPLVLMRVAIREKRACNECASDKTNHSRQKCIFQFGSIQSSGRCHVHEQLTQSRSLAWDAAWSVTQHWWTIYAMICYNIMLDNFRGYYNNGRIVANACFYFWNVASWAFPCHYICACDLYPMRIRPLVPSCGISIEIWSNFATKIQVSDIICILLLVGDYLDRWKRVVIPSWSLISYPVICVRRYKPFKRFFYTFPTVIYFRRAVLPAVHGSFAFSTFRLSYALCRR